MNYVCYKSEFIIMVMVIHLLLSHEGKFWALPWGRPVAARAAPITRCMRVFVFPQFTHPRVNRGSFYVHTMFCVRVYTGGNKLSVSESAL